MGRTLGFPIDTVRHDSCRLLLSWMGRLDNSGYNGAVGEFELLKQQKAMIIIKF